VPSVFCTCIPLPASPYDLCCDIETRIYQPHFRWTWGQDQQAY